jgi:hypothetical protein
MDAVTGGGESFERGHRELWRAAKDQIERLSH